MHQHRVLATRAAGLAIIMSLVSAFFLSNSVWATIAISVTPTSVEFECDNLDRGNSGTVNGVSLSCGLNASGSQTFNESIGQFSFEGDWNELGLPFTSGSSTAYFVNASNDVTGILSYTFSVANEIGDITGTFQFDNSNAPGLGTVPGGATIIVQDGNEYDFNNTAFAGHLTTQVDPTEAPEPASLAILAAGLAGMGWVRRRGPSDRIQQ